MTGTQPLLSAAKRLYTISCASAADRPGSQDNMRGLTQRSRPKSPRGCVGAGRIASTRATTGTVCSRTRAHIGDFIMFTTTGAGILA